VRGGGDSGGSGAGLPRLRGGAGRGGLRGGGG
jgi:hypothetical protein